MSIDAIMQQYRAEKVPNIIRDYRLVKSGFRAGSSDTDKAEAPWWGGDIVEEAADKDYLCAKALTSLAVLNGPTDVDEIYSAWKQIKSKFKDNKQDGYDPKVAQHPFSFFRGTVLHEYLNPNSEKCLDKKLAKKVIKADVSLAETKLGEWILDKLGVEEVKRVPSNVESLLHTKDVPDYVLAKVYKSKNKFADLTARALARTPKLGVFVLGSLGAIHAGYEIADGKNIFEEVGKTALEVGTTLAGVGYLGAAGYKHLGAFGSLTGMAAGTALGALVPKVISSSNQDVS